MIAFWTLVLVSTIVLALLMLAAVWLMNKAGARLVGDKHRTLESIIETGQVPQSWRSPYERKSARLAGDEENAMKIATLQAKARQHYLKRLDELVRYVRTSSLVDGEDTRTMLLDRLTAVRMDWQEDRK